MKLRAVHGDGQCYQPSAFTSCVNVYSLHNLRMRTPLNLQSRMLRRSALVLAMATLAACSSVIPPPTTSGAVPTASPKWGMALGGGAARGFAHIGVIQVLEENGLAPDLVTGTSAGSLVAAIYASGKSGQQLQAIAQSLDEASIADWTVPFLSKGLLRGEALARYVNAQVGGRKLEEMKILLGVVATNFQTGDEVVFRKGDTGTAVRASSAIPAVFNPVRIGNVEYVDGGLVSPVPVTQARAMGAQVVLAVDISTPPSMGRTEGAVDMILQTTSIMGRSINQYALKQADVVVRPALDGVRGSDFSQKQQAIAAGRQAMLAALPKLKEALRPVEVKP
jgi:NTE family protein